MLRIAHLVFHCLMIVRIDAKAQAGGGGSNLSVGLTLRVLISNFDSPLKRILKRRTLGQADMCVNSRPFLTLVHCIELYMTSIT